MAKLTEEEFLIRPLKTKLNIFWLLVPFLSTLSVASVVLSISTTNWLYTLERMPNPRYNGTGDEEFLFKRTVSGLWTYCFTEPGASQFSCKRIDYFSQENYIPDPQDSTLVIPYVVSKAAIHFLLASCTMMAAFICCILGQCVRYRGIYTFISGLLFIFTGLIMLLGLVVYISVFKSEVGSKLRPQSHVRPPLFEYQYGYSFLMYIIGLCSTKLAGVGCVFLFMYRVQYHWKRSQFDEWRKGTRSGTFLRMEPPQPLEYPCRKHPYLYINSNSTIYKPPQDSPCSLHRSRVHQSTPSLKDVAHYEFPPPPTISYKFNERRLNRDVTMNTVSTSVDVNLDELFDEYSPSLRNEFVAFDLDEPLPVRAQSIVSLSSRGRRFEGEGMRRTTPV